MGYDLVFEFELCVSTQNFSNEVKPTIVINKSKHGFTIVGF